MLPDLEEKVEHSSGRNVEARGAQVSAEAKQGLSAAALRLAACPNGWPGIAGLLTSCFLQKAPHPSSAKLLTTTLDLVSPWKKKEIKKEPRSHIRSAATLQMPGGVPTQQGSID